MRVPKRTTTAALTIISNYNGEIKLRANAKAAPGSQIIEWSIDWGDGESEDGTVPLPATVDHSYIESGEKLVIFTVKDSKNKIVSTGLNVLIVRISTPNPNPAIPNITNVFPSSGSVGSSVTISGTNFGSTQGTSKVYFNGTLVTSVSSWSSTSISCSVPSGATTGQVTVVVSNESSNGVNFTVTGAPSFNYYVLRVADGGSDSNPGTLSQPFATLSKAFSVILPGQSIGILPGTGIYTERLNLTWPSGMSGNIITVSGTDQSNRPVFQAAADISNYAFRIAGSQYLTIRDIIIDYTNVPALGLGGRIENSNNIILQRCRLRNLINGINSPDDGQLITVGGSDSVTDSITLLDSEFDHCGDTIATNFQHGIYVLNATNVIQDGCYVHDIGAYGTQYFWGSGTGTVHNGAIVRNGRYTRCGRSGILMGGCDNGQIYNNRSWNNGIGLLGSGGGGIRLGALTVSNTKVWYNSCYNNNGGGSQGNFWAGAESSNVEFRDNIARDGSPNYQNDGSGTVQDHNFNFGGTNNDPLWVDPANADFHLQSGSSARDIGIPVAITVDAAGNPRSPTTPDAGCFEFV